MSDPSDQPTEPPPPDPRAEPEAGPPAPIDDAGAEIVTLPAAALLDEPAHEENAAEPPSTPAPEPAAQPPRRRRWALRLLLAAVLMLLVFPPALTLVYKLVPPPITLLMIERAMQGQGLDKSWRGLSDIAPALPQAVIAAEDARFCRHHGFDWEAMRAAAAYNARRSGPHMGKMRGGSTLSQQTAKNVFLWPSRDYLRKGLEAYFTLLEEAIWGKRRILEIYLNVVEWGPGTYGAEAAARRYFNTEAADLTPEQAARLAAILPDPLKWKAVNPGRYVQRRSARIDARAAVVRQDDLAACIR